MPLTTKPVTQISEAELQALISDKEAEGKTIDYKRDRLGQSDTDKKEFLYDVSSFANASGGHLIFGMDENEGLPVALPGLASVNPDEEIARLEQIARDGLRPPIIGLQSAAVRLANGNIAIVVYIPKSWNPPHQVTYQKAFRFDGRDTNSKYQLDVDELRSIFSLSEGVAEKIRLFRIDRVAKIVAGETPSRLRAGAKMVTHVLPLSAFTSSNVVDLRPIANDPMIMMGIGGDGGSCRLNVDGVILEPRLDAERPSYVQVYRNGCVEVIHCTSKEALSRAVLSGPWFETRLVFAVQNSLRLLQARDVQPPVVILLSMLGMKGWHIAAPPEYGGGSVFDRDPLFLPETIIDAFGGVPQTTVRPLIDIVWNAAGWPGSLNYDQEGRWTVR